MLRLGVQPTKFGLHYLGSCSGLGATFSECLCRLRHIQAHVPPRTTETYDRAVATETHEAANGLRVVDAGRKGPGHPGWLREATAVCSRKR